MTATDAMSDSKTGRAVFPVGTLMRAPKTAELIASHLRRQIVKGDLKPGDTLPSEVHLMDQFGVSRPTLREAYRILETESLIGVRRGARGGAQVLEPDPRVAARHVGLLLQLQDTTIRDVYDARIVGESACARLLAKVRSEDDLQALRDVIADLTELVEAGYEAVPDLARWSGTTYRFHELIMQRCGNKTLAVQGAVLADIVAMHLQLTIGQSIADHDDQPTRFQKTLRSYRKMVRLLEARDAEAAETHWRRHMDVAATYLFSVDKNKNYTVVDLFG